MNRLSIQVGVGVLSLALAAGVSFAGKHKLNGTGDSTSTTQPSETGHETRKKLVEKFDKDGDGKLNEDERAAAMKDRLEHGHLRQRIIEKFDKDGDGKLNDEEKAAAKATMEKHLGKHASTQPSA